MLCDLEDQCRLAWGAAYPRPVKINNQKGEWIFHFKNHEADAKPSTIVYGDYRKLQINGRHDFQREFFLPDDLSAQQMGDYLAQKYGRQLPTGPNLANLATPKSDQNVPTTGLQFYKANRKRWDPGIAAHAERCAAAFPEPIIEDKNAMKLIYRKKLGDKIAHARMFGSPMLIRSVEGVGKSSALRGILRGEALDQPDKLVAFAYRSREQAREKAAEFSEHGFATVAIMPFWEHLNEICDDLGQDRIDREEVEEDVDSLELCEILAEICVRHPQAYAELERRRKAIWSEHPFSATTLVAMTHKAAQLWPHNAGMRAWHHPDFDPDGDPAQVQALSNDFDLSEIVFDDPEFDDFVHVIPDHVYSKMQSLQEANPNWHNIRRRERKQIYHSVRTEVPFQSFYEFDTNMRIQLDNLAPYKVGCDRYPYGQDNPQAKHKLYMNEAARTFYIGPQSWLSDISRDKCTFLTTEKLVADVIQRCFEVVKHRSRLMSLDLTNMPGIFPIKIPVFLDPRAWAREKDIEALVHDIRTNDSNSVIIANGVEAKNDVYKFQGMKGLNGLETSNIYVIMTWFAPEHYEKLNILGQWLDSDKILLDYYVDQLCQAVGRNTGFRQCSPEAKISVTMSSSLWKKYLFRLNDMPSRVKLYEIDEAPWRSELSLPLTWRRNMNPMLLLLPPSQHSSLLSILENRLERGDVGPLSETMRSPSAPARSCYESMEFD
jgi:hypothetical protein